MENNNLLFSSFLVEFYKENYSRCQHYIVVIQINLKFSVI